MLAARVGRLKITDPEPAQEDTLLRAYLLRTLPEAERNAVDCRLLTDDAYYEAACAMEGDLLAGYAARELSAAEAAVVRGWLAASAEVRERLELIQLLVKQADRVDQL